MQNHISFKQNITPIRSKRCWIISQLLKKKACFIHDDMEKHLCRENNKAEKVRFKNSQNKWSQLSEYRREQKRVIESLPRKGQTGFKHDPIFSSITGEELHCRESSCGWQALIRPCVCVCESDAAERLSTSHRPVKVVASVTDIREGCRIHLREMRAFTMTTDIDMSNVPIIHFTNTSPALSSKYTFP